MFDALQEGICTIDDDKIIFMNELCNTFTSQLSGLRDFEKNIDVNDNKTDQNPLDRKIFFLFQNDKDDKKKSKTSGSTEKSKINTITSKSMATDQLEFSINDIIKVDIQELNGKIFTYDKRLAQGDLTKI